MRALIQRVSAATVEIVGEDPSSIEDGLVIFIGIGRNDSLEDVEYLVEKILNLRIFASEDKDFDKSAIDVQAELLVISQFTLFANTRRGRRPSFSMAATPDDAKDISSIDIQGVVVGTAFVDFIEKNLNDKQLPENIGKITKSFVKHL